MAPAAPGAVLLSALRRWSPPGPCAASVPCTHPPTRPPARLLPRPPCSADANRTRTYKTKAETEAKKPVTSTIVLTLLFISVVVPMLQYWGEARLHDRRAAVWCRAGWLAHWVVAGCDAVAGAGLVWQQRSGSPQPVVARQGRFPTPPSLLPHPRVPARLHQQGLSVVTACRAAAGPQRRKPAIPACLVALPFLFTVIRLRCTSAHYFFARVRPLLC